MRQRIRTGATCLLVSALLFGAHSLARAQDLRAMKIMGAADLDRGPWVLPSVQIEPFKAAGPLNDRLDADAVFGRPYVDSLHDAMAWYLEQRGVNVVGVRGEFRLAAAVMDYEGWRRPGRWGARLSLRVRLYKGQRVVLTETAESRFLYPNESAALPAANESGWSQSSKTLTAQEALFTRIGLDLSEQVLSLIQRAAGTRASEKEDEPVDGALVGTTPLVDFILGAGPHVLEVRKEGYQPWTRRIHVIERASSRFYAEMRPQVR